MASPIVARLVKGFAANGFSQAVSMAIQLVNVPLLIHFWGADTFAYWVVLSTIPQLVAMSDLSFGSAAGNSMTMRTATGDREGALRVFQSAWVLITLITVCVGILGVAFVTLVPIEQFLKLGALDVSVAKWVMVLLVLQTVLTMQGGMITAAYRCDGLYARGVTLRNVLRLADFLAMLAVVSLGGWIVAAAIAGLVAKVVGYGLIMLDVRKKLPWIQWGWKHASRAEIKPLIGPAISFNAFPIANALSISGVVVVISAILGPSVAATYSTTRTVARVINQMVGAINNTVWVELSTALGARDFDLARRLHRRSSQITFWIAALGSGLMFVAAKPLYQLWTKEEFTFEPLLLALLLAMGVVNSLWAASATVPISINRNQRLSAMLLATTLVSLGLAAVSLPTFGVWAAPAALLVAEIAMAAFVFRVSLSIVHDTPARYFGTVLQPPFGYLWGRFLAPAAGRLRR